MCSVSANNKADVAGRLVVKSSLRVNINVTRLAPLKSDWSIFSAHVRMSHCVKWTCIISGLIKGRLAALADSLAYCDVAVVVPTVSELCSFDTVSDQSARSTMVTSSAGPWKVLLALIAAEQATISAPAPPPMQTSLRSVGPLHGFFCVLLSGVVDEPGLLRSNSAKIGVYASARVALHLSA